MSKGTNKMYLSDKKDVLPQALFFKYVDGVPIQVGSSEKELHQVDGFWATVIKRYPEVEKNRQATTHAVWLLKKSDHHFMVLIDQGYCSTKAVVVCPHLPWAEQYFETFKKLHVVQYEVSDLIFNAETDGDPEGRMGPTKRAMRIVREKFHHATGMEISTIAAILGVEMTKEKLLRRPNHATTRTRTPCK
jgi:hypothetical protein